MLVPREHGAYGQLLFPLVSALVAGHPAAGAYLLAASSVAAFLGHEAVLVLLGQRGNRAAREQGFEARRAATLFGASWIGCGIAALDLMSRQAIPFLLIPGALAAAVAVLVIRHRERSTGGELLAATALSSASLPVAVAGGVEVRSAFTLFIVFAAAFATATVAVRAVIGRVSRAGGPPLAAAAGLAVAVVTALALLVLNGNLAPVAPFAALPVCGLALALAIARPSPRYLRPIGWALVAASAATAVILIVAFR